LTSSPTELLVDITMPQMGVSVTEGTIIAWTKRVGDEIAADETICEISTDKIDTEVPAPASGVVREILVEAGATVAVATVLARIATGDATATARPPRPPADSWRGGGRGNVASGVFGSPVALRVAREHGIDLAAVAGTGRGGRVRKADVLGAISAREREAEPRLHGESPYRPEPSATAVPDALPTPARALPGALPEGSRAVPLSTMRRAIAKHMTMSVRTAPHCTTVVEADVTFLERRRRQLGITALPLIARHVLDVLRDFPGLNAWMREDTIVMHERVHLGIAVSLGDDGLIVPVVRDAQELSVEGLAHRIRTLAERARAGQLEPRDVGGATFTLTNPGALGAIIATPIINQPQVAILDTEAVVRRPVVVADAGGHESIAIRSMMHLCLSWDHRALDGVYAARFLTAVRNRVERRPS
jgi:pyruvate/2-oxoglutarate dehydrogenase complex dihydrolipoamide acyltransferase (E2) component